MKVVCNAGFSRQLSIGKKEQREERQERAEVEMQRFAFVVRSQFNLQ